MTSSQPRAAAAAKKRIAVLAPYPRTGACSGIADYTATILQHLDVTPLEEIVVFADRSRGEARSRTRDGHVIVRRCWVPGWSAPFRILISLLGERFDVVHVEYDIYLFGGILSAVLIPLLLAFLRFARGTQTVVTLHGIVPQNEVTPELLRENGLTFPFSRVGKLGFAMLYRLFALGAQRIIALERSLADALIADYGFRADRVFALPHPPMKQETFAAHRLEPIARSKRRLLYFGYASYYKGLPLLIDAFEIARRTLPDIELIMVAGRHPRLRGDVAYEQWYANLLHRATDAGITAVGWLDDVELGRQIARCSAMILPYTRMYGASGPLNTAIAARRPALVSSRVHFSGALPCQVFEPTESACADAIVSYFTANADLLDEAARDLAALRCPATVAQAHHVVRSGTRPARAGSPLSLLPQTLHLARGLPQPAPARSATDSRQAPPSGTARS